MTTTSASDDTRVATGIVALDDILGGCFPACSLYLVEGDPGSGKTTLGLQFLLEGARRGESGLYVTMSESKAELEKVARSHGWDLAPLTIVELSPSEETLEPDAQLTMFH